ncbi:MAG: transporter substrate-binding domain-containing protein [Selenomonadaceae bacterium]|nr:transporter substrate-binding domain-containing protein [Selenomonadaceae bacterium]
MKKIFTIFSALIIFSAILTGCGENQPAPVDTKLGMIRHLNASEEEFNNFTKKVADTFSIRMTTYNPVFYDNLQSMILALDSGEVGVISTYDCVAKYLVAKNPKYEIMTDDTLEFIDAFCFLMRSEDVELKDSVNNALLEMNNDGTLERLTKTYITNAKADDPPAVEIPHIDGAEMLKVAVTGDLPPLDLVLADGKPAGFNTALIAELGKRLNKNIEIFNIDSAARSSALKSERADLIFWAIVPVSEIIPADADIPAGTIISSPYYRARITHVKLKN